MLILVSAASVFAEISFDERIKSFLPEPQIFRSIFNKRQSGLSALYEIATQLHLPCAPWQSPYSNLDDRRGLLLIVDPLSPISRAEMDEIMEWVHHGNQLVYLDDSPSSPRYFADLAFEFKRKLVDQSLVQPVYPLKQIPEFSFVKHLLISARTRIVGGQPWLADDQGAFLTESKYGAGRVLRGTTAALCSNNNITDPNHWSNFQFLINIFATSCGDVLIDERCHGFRSSNNFFVFLFSQAEGLVIGQILLVLLVSLVSANQRFGGIRLADQKRRLSNLEFVRGMARFYQRLGGASLALEVIEGDFRARICRRLSVSAEADDPQLIEAVFLSDPDIAKAVQAFFLDTKALRQRRFISQNALVKQVRACDLLSDRIESLLTKRQVSIK